MQVRGLDYDEIQVVTGNVARISSISAADLVAWAGELKRVVGTPVFQVASDAHKRAKNYRRAGTGQSTDCGVLRIACRSRPNWRCATRSIA